MDDNHHPQGACVRHRPSQASLASEVVLPLLDEGADRFDEHSCADGSGSPRENPRAGQPDGMPGRVFAVVRLQRGIFERIGEDPRATVQALVVFVVAGMLPSLPGLLSPNAVEALFSELEALAPAGPYSDSYLAWLGYLRDLDPVVSIGLLSSGGLMLGLFNCFLRAGMAKILARLVAAEIPGFKNWLRAYVYCGVADVLTFIPWVGGIMAFGYGALLEIAAIRDLARISSGQAVLVGIASRALLYLTWIPVAVVAILVTTSLLTS